MPRIKIWTANRSKRVAVNFEDFDTSMEIIIREGSQKLGIKGIMLVAEEDGTSVLDTDDLQYYCEHEKPILFLERNETWSHPLPTIGKGKDIAENGNPTEPEQNNVEHRDLTDDKEPEQDNNNHGHDNNNLQLENADMETVDNNRERDENRSDPVNQQNNNDDQQQDEIVNYFKAKRDSFVSWDEYVVPWTNLPAVDVLACHNGTATERNKHNVVQSVITDMRFYNVLIRRQDLQKIAKQFMIKFPIAFKDLDEDGETLDNGYNGILKKLEDHNNYLNRTPNRRPNLTDQLNIKLKDRRSLEAIQSGTINWQPPQIAEGETEESIENNRIFLCAYNFENIQKIIPETELETKLNSTFAIQRLFLNNIKNPPNINDIEANWSFLLYESCLLWHFEKLTGISLDQMSQKYELKIKKKFFTMPNGS
ncbi:putative histone-lysine N-methyltransferase 1 isoform X2 [Leptopilina heterotoma]|nr:putative histone-lysine N-methyltransferase 1 isoform X2 [Leptopilina heterotoma]